MTAKECVIEKMPTARAERHVAGRNEVYWLIREGRNYMYFSEGKTESKAWSNAKKKMIEVS